MPVVLLSCRCLQCVDIGCLPVVARMALAAFMALSDSIAPTPCSEVGVLLFLSLPLSYFLLGCAP